MKKKIICLLLSVLMLLSCGLVLASCSDPADDDEVPEGVDVGDESSWWRQVMYEETELRFQLTECPDAGLHPNTKRLLQGDEDASLGRPLDDLIATRNDNAYFNTNVKVSYNYYGTDTAVYGWSNAMNTIYTEVQNKSDYSPDIYCNFMSDMLGTSLKGSFANLLSESRNSAGAGTVSNFFKPDETINNEGYEHSGYMSDLMSSLTLSDEKFYIIASDYFVDLIRAFFVVPVDKTLYNSIASKMIDDLNEDGVTDMNDFFEEIKNNDWTYERLREYCEEIADDDGNAVWELKDDTLGWALDSWGGMMGSGLMYTTDLVIIEKKWNDDEFMWEYNYPETNEKLEKFVGEVYKIFHDTPGTVAIYEKDAVSKIADAFIEHKLLFGGIVTVGSLENADYQAMKGTGGGFGIVPVPVYTNLDENGDKVTEAPYQTQIHTTGGAGGISVITKKFTQCSAFIQYQSTHSTEILNEYYENNLTADVSDGLEGNVYMMQYIRENVRTSFDKLFEDAIAFFNKQTDPNAQYNRWHNILLLEQYQLESMRDYYDELVGTKQDRLEILIKEYSKLPD